MDKEKQKQLSNSPIVVWLGIISSIIAIFAFVTGYQSLSAITTQISPTPVEPSAPIDIDPLPEKTIVGLWERRSSEITEQFNLQSDGAYTIEARNNSTGDVVASNNGTFTYDENKINYVDKENVLGTESYYLDNGGDLLVLNNQIERAWTRVK